jgi:mono/diheme cytochrome c family protein
MQNMYEQPKYKTLTASTLWEDGKSARPDEPGTVARSAGVLAGTSSGRLGETSPPEHIAPAYPPDDAGRLMEKPAPGTLPADAVSNPLPVTLATLKRGQQRYGIYCAPCHGETGDGDGMVVRRGFPAPPSYHSQKFRHAPDAHFYSVISNGYGVMYSYADVIEPRDRWAIIEYIRALQLSQDARIDDAPQGQRSLLQKIPK